jgi:hypothetical protein
MKKVIKPAAREESVYYSDFSGKCFGELYPPVELTISCSYGSKHDGAGIELHLDDEEMEPFLELIKKSISEDCKIKLKKQLESAENTHYDAMQMRDWEHCDIVSNSIWFWRELLGLTNEEEEGE